MSTLPTGNLPADYKTTIASLIREVGVGSMTSSSLIARLEAKYKVSFENHREPVKEYVTEFMQTPEMRRELAAIQRDAEQKVGGKGKGKKSARATSPKDKDSKKAKKEQAAKKPDDYPKGALSAYIIFAGDFREQHKDMPVREQMSKAGEAWKAIDTDARKPYEAKAIADKERHEMEMAAYLAKGGAVFKRGAKGAKVAKKAKDPNAPKRALSSFFFFAADFREQHKGMPVKEQMSKAGEAWKAMNDDSRRPYEAKAAADKERYIRECAAKGIKTTAAGAKASAKGDNKDAASSSSDSSDSDSSSSDEDDE